MNGLQALLNPGSIAILGASADLTKVNGRTLKYLLAKGYAGRIFPVNPKYQAIGELPCYPGIAAVPGPVDLAIVALPAALVPDTLRDLGRHGVKAAVVFSSGFAETGAAGRALEREAVAAARESGLRLCGPNCLGLINAFDRVIATFGQYADGETPPGPVGFVTQSGAFGTAIAALARRRSMGLGYFINTGNEGDVDFVQAMRAVLDDPRIKVGAGYIEGLKDGPGLLGLADFALEQGKPLVLTKVGKHRRRCARRGLAHRGARRRGRTYSTVRSADTASSAPATRSTCSTWSRCSPRCGLPRRRRLGHRHAIGRRRGADGRPRRGTGPEGAGVERDDTAGTETGDSGFWRRRQSGRRHRPVRRRAGIVARQRAHRAGRSRGPRRHRLAAIDGCLRRCFN